VIGTFAAPQPQSRRSLTNAKPARELYALPSTLVGALALAGIAELVLQRVVYRIGIHLPRSGAALDVYEAATTAGDFAFRLTAVLLATAVVATAVWLYHNDDAVSAAFLLALAIVNLAVWALGLTQAAVLAPVLLILAGAWLAGRALGGAPGVLSGAAAAAVVAVAASHFLAGLRVVGQPTPLAGEVQFLSEAALLLSVVLAALAARAATSRVTFAASGMAAFVLVAAYAREPSTVAILSLWTVGATMSLPPVLYLGAFWAFALATLSWASSTQTRHLAIALCLLLVAGLQPQALHHGLTALLGLALLSLGGPASSRWDQKMEVTDAS
jgi:hypothetical protein